MAPSLKRGARSSCKEQVIHGVSVEKRGGNNPHEHGSQSCLVAFLGDADNWNDRGTVYTLGLAKKIRGMDALSLALTFAIPSKTPRIPSGIPSRLEAGQWWLIPLVPSGPGVRAA